MTLIYVMTAVNLFFMIVSIWNSAKASNDAYTASYSADRAKTSENMARESENRLYGANRAVNR